MAATALLFDLDGTICDSRPWYAEVLVICGGDRPFVTAQLASGRPITKVAKDLGVARRHLTAVCRDHVHKLRLYPRAQETLRSAATRGTPMALVTSLSAQLADVVLGGHDLYRYFRAVVTPWWGMRPKPHPESLLKGLALLGLPPDSGIYYVGDLSSDGAAAMAAGVSFAWASWGYGDGISSDVAVTLHSFPEVLTL